MLRYFTHKVVYLGFHLLLRTLFCICECLRFQQSFIQVCKLCAYVLKTRLRLVAVRIKAIKLSQLVLLLVNTDVKLVKLRSQTPDLLLHGPIWFCILRARGHILHLEQLVVQILQLGVHFRVVQL